MNECDDPECPGCLMEKAIRAVLDAGMDADDVVALFFASLDSVIQEPVLQETVH